MYPAGRTILHLLILGDKQIPPRRSDVDPPVCIFQIIFFLFFVQPNPYNQNIFLPESLYSEMHGKETGKTHFFILATDSPMDI